MEKFNNLKILNDNVLVILYTQTQTNNGIILTKKSQEQEVKIIGVVSAVGSKVRNTEDIKEGAVVVVPRHTGKWVEFKGYKYALFKENDILAILPDMEYGKLN